MSDKGPRFVSRLTRDTLALILAGGRGSRLRQLTDWRSKPAVPFGGKFRIVDFPLSNCINSGIRRIGVITQYKAHSLILHIQKGWGILRAELGEFVELWPAQQRIDEAAWYAGTADAVYQNQDIIRNHKPDYILVLAGDHIYKMDYGAMVAYHVRENANMTVGCIEVELAHAKPFGIMTVDAENRVCRFHEKPEHPEPIPGRRDRPCPGLHGDLRLQQRLSVRAARQGRGQARFQPRFRQGYHSRSHRRASGNGLSLSGCAWQRSSLLARCGDRRRLLGGEPGDHRRDAAAQPL
ncbi:MAG: Glucose-1-phosphate adenylyltransferase (EC 2.7.7.27) [Olavius algarvensis Gamma 1 endosymbiont]|nr:MAG: Glucose-1-phosphate adenylyltransferase (EC 2.7.7.27) [Olavius algarvensis Gamma 1 endosymbiont]